MSYTIRTHGPHAWVAERDSDGERMTSGTIWGCLRWVKAWGGVDLGR